MPANRQTLIVLFVVLWAARELIPMLTHSDDSDSAARGNSPDTAAGPVPVPTVTVLVPGPPCVSSDSAMTTSNGLRRSTGAVRTPQPEAPTVMGVVGGRQLPTYFQLPVAPPPVEQQRRGNDFTKATEAATELPCLAPIVCQSAAGCVPAATAKNTAPLCAWQLPELDPTIRAAATSVIVEVGTNKQPETASLPPPVPKKRYTIAVEPLRVEGRHLWSHGFATVLVSAAASPARGNITLSTDGVATTLTEGALTQGGSRFVAPVLPLSEVIERLVPPNVRGEMLIIDAQGFDVRVVESAETPNLARFELVIVECEELWAQHPDRLVRTAPLCSEIARRVETEITNGTFRFAGCMRNVGAFEYNCLFVNVGGSGGGSGKVSAIAQAFNAFNSAEMWPPVADAAAIRKFRANESLELEPAPWLDDVDIATWPPGLLQLATLMPIRRALEVAFVMCPTLLIASRAHSRCVMHDTALLREMLFVRNACLRWQKTCSDPRARPARKRLCFSQMAPECR